MANRNSHERNVRKLGKESQTSVGVTLPIELVRQLGWHIKQKVTVRKWGKNKLIVEDWNNK